MQTMPTGRIHGSDDLSGPAALRWPASGPTALQRLSRDEQFLEMLRGYRRTGGLARGHDVASLLASRAGLNIGTLARWIVQDEVVRFDWQHDTWLPMFQFAGPDMAPRAGVGRMLKELRGVYDPWGIAQWFVRPSASLGHLAPADSMELDPELLLQAARFDR